MLARPDSSAPSGLSTASAAPFPAWARALHPPDSEAEAGFLAGAALARLDAIARENPPWAGAWRQRLALQAAAASVARAGRAGRSEDEAALRDALPLGRPGARRTNVLLPAFRMDAMRGFPRLRLRRLERVQHGDDEGFRSRRGEAGVGEAVSSPWSAIACCT